MTAPFSVWFNAIGVIVKKATGIPIEDCPDQAYREMYDYDWTPEQVAKLVIQDLYRYLGVN